MMDGRALFLDILYIWKYEYTVEWFDAVCGDDTLYRVDGPKVDHPAYAVQGFLPRA
jgi:hypothetical protein